MSYTDATMDASPVPAMSTLAKRTPYKDEDGNYTSAFRNARAEFDSTLAVRVSEMRRLKMERDAHSVDPYTRFTANECLAAKAACKEVPKKKKLPKTFKWVFSKVIRPRV